MIVATVFWSEIRMKFASIAVALRSRYTALHDTNLSRLVSDFLAVLPLDEEPEQLPPTVRRLVAVGVPPNDASEEDPQVQSYRDYLYKKYGNS